MSNYSAAFHCASASRWCKCRTLTAIGVDGVKNDKEVHGRAIKRCEDAGEQGVQTRSSKV